MASHHGSKQVYSTFVPCCFGRTEAKKLAALGHVNGKDGIIFFCEVPSIFKASSFLLDIYRAFLAIEIPTLLLKLAHIRELKFDDCA
jgi:hypothetical protein